MKAITEDYVSFEVAKLLKEKGFQAKCTACYYNDQNHTFKLISGRVNYCNPKFNKYKMIPPYNAPTLQMAIKWLRKHGWIICIIPLTFRCGEGVSEWGCCIWADDNLEIDEDDTPRYNTYEQACESAIKYCLEYLSN